MRPYLYIAKTRILRALAYRFDVLSGIAIQGLIVIASSFFWVAAYGSQQEAMGVTRDQMLTYTIMSGVLACLYTMGVEHRIASSVRHGQVALDILKPVNIFAMYLAEDLGSVGITFAQNALPLLIISSLFIAVPVPSSLLHFGLFLLSAACSYMINWLISALTGMMAFRVISINPILGVKSHLLRLLSGSVIPLWFFPGWMQSVLSFLPFKYVYQLPLSIYIGILSPTEIVGQMSIQLIWVALLGGAFAVISRKAVSHVLIQGG